MIDWSPFWVSFRLALWTELFLLPIGFFLVYILYFLPPYFKPFLKTFTSLPLILPPTVLGYYLLILFRPDSFLGQFTETLFGLRLVFSFEGLTLASVFIGIPFMVNPILSALENLPLNYQEVAFSLGKSRFITFYRVLLPNIKPAILTAIVFTFAHTLGEFGVILMIGGNIPEETQTASIAIYNEVEMMNYETADTYAFILFALAFVVLLGLNFLEQKKEIL